MIGIFKRFYRSTDYPPQAKSEGVMHALKAFRMSPFSNETAMLLVRNYVLKARDLVIQELLSKRNGNEEEGKIQYKYLIPPQEKQLFLKELKTTSDEFKDGFQKEDLLILREISLLAHLSMFELNKLIECSTVTTFEDGTLLFLEGDPVQDLYVILEGRVRLYKKDHFQEETDIILLEKRALFGEMALLEGGKRDSSAQVVGPSKLFVIKGTDFIKYVF